VSGHQAIIFAYHFVSLLELISTSLALIKFNIFTIFLAIEQ